MTKQIKSNQIADTGSVVYGAIPREPVFRQPYPDDEIDLVDLWLVLIRHKTVIAVIACLVLLAGSLFALSMPTKFNYSTSIQIGAVVEMDSGRNHFVFIEEPETVLAKINETYIPYALNRYSNENPDSLIQPDIKARIPKKSSLIVLEARGEEKYEAIYQTLLKAVAEMVVEDHQPSMRMMDSEYASNLNRQKIKLAELQAPSTLQIQLKSLEVQLTAAQLRMEELNDDRLIAVSMQSLLTEKQNHQNKLKTLADERKQLNADYRRLDEMDKLLNRQIEALNSSIRSAATNRQASLREVDNEASAMTLLLVDSQLQTNRNKLASLEERLYIHQQSAREKLKNALNANKLSRDYEQKLLANNNDRLEKVGIDLQRERQKQQTVIDNLNEKFTKVNHDSARAIERQALAVAMAEARLNSLKQTRPVFEPIQSLKPVGTSKKLILVASLMLGLFLGVFVAFGLEFLAKANAKMKQQNA
ncbi:MAG: Wzz/FepE/Etk N-terminal domain-containing protein [Gammaproteobacteria bacterium]|nr:Wzz/FepE/Etk N-terminal domain-containing protein [Gammaproteobacteria bacterium]